MKTKQRSDYTFKYNKRLRRHGWLRLTPAYSVKLVKEIIQNIPEDACVIDPFSGTATTGVVAAECGLSADCFEINPFLVWLGKAKCKSYTESEKKRLYLAIKELLWEFKKIGDKDNWSPEIYNITRWWSQETLAALSAFRQALVNQFGEPRENEKGNDISALAWIAFCRLAIETSSAGFNHVSMSLGDKVKTFGRTEVAALYQEIISSILQDATDLAGLASVQQLDSRELRATHERKYSYVVTSPPYPNRISYIRELRPYMYWTRFLETAKEAGELDWQAIGGTWGVATSRLRYWKMSKVELPPTLDNVVSQILETKEKNALLMGNYVWKYFHDMHLHFRSLKNVLKEGAILSYIVGNSSFYGVQVHTEKLFEDSLKSLGFTDIRSQIIRKRNSKKELFEYCLQATWEGNSKCETVSLGEGSAKEKQLTFF